MLDQTDLEILQLLRKNSRMQWKEIGEIVHMTGQATSGRIRRLEEIGIIEGYTVKINEEKLGRIILALITVFMKSNDHRSFQNFVRQEESIVESHRISGDGCYWLKARVKSQNDLEKLLDNILRYGNYRLQISISEITNK
ncbi:Lrp/AsnC family transcriptional regulator [Heliophilum fasciatum]|uniref:AsnC family transcriptional regulator n=1 Tax=Heliophilum fasciatum TaxID=35700 RepID=A0A4R2R9P3_9FIRM|nr:Lrp/AsnC family transcriptional regulator [Heliophilum fasciatum]MCW2279490.1 Lrp/AsnC family leucine-responsive transcriptional regulator [Heliophilum fasciatum]TCP58798.1 AsnC family transcriptional regulator [Heliophilum fasciatum]